MPHRALVQSIAVGFLCALSACSAPQPEGSATTEDPTLQEPAPPTEPETTAAQPAAGKVFKQVDAALEAGVDPATETFVFYLHGGVVEGSDGRPTHPQRGTYEYQAIIDAMVETGVTVLSEIRPADTDVDTYAGSVTQQVQALLQAGAAPQRVAVVGFSKGGNIALRVSHLLEHDDVAFVILAACGEWLENTSLDLRGRVLSIFEASDDVADSCAPAVARSQTQPFFHEIETQMGKGHGSFFEPRDAWLLETMLWCNAPRLQNQISAPERIDVGS